MFYVIPIGFKRQSVLFLHIFFKPAKHSLAKLLLHGSGLVIISLKNLDQLNRVACSKMDSALAAIVKRVGNKPVSYHLIVDTCKIEVQATVL